METKWQETLRGRAIFGRVYDLPMRDKARMKNSDARLEDKTLVPTTSENSTNKKFGGPMFSYIYVHTHSTYDTFIHFCTHFGGDFARARHHNFDREREK